MYSHVLAIDLLRLSQSPLLVQLCADCGTDRDPQIFLRTRIIRGPDDWNRLQTRTVRGSKPQ